MKKIETPKNIAKLYRSSDLRTTSIDNYDFVRRYQSKVFGGDDVDVIMEFNKTFQSRIESFKELWGRQDFCFNNEYRMYAWLVDHEGCEAIIFSGKGKGTVVEIVLDEDLEPKGSVELFYLEFVKLMCSFS